MSIFGGPSVDQLKGTLFARMSKIGGTYLEASYSGGNDEGGVDRVKLFTVTDPEVRVQIELPDSEGDWTDDENAEATLYDLCNDILATEFYTWAGEFEAYGTLYATLDDHKVWREGEMTSGYDSDSAEF